jgi:hypothetical protein
MDMAAMNGMAPVPAPRPYRDTGVITLHFEPSAIAGQNSANSYGKPVRTPSGKVYQPMAGYGPPKPVTAPRPMLSLLTPVAALQARGLSPSQAYAAANANAAAAAQANATSGYTPSSSGQSNDYFTNARNGSVPDINYGISGSYSSGGARSLT